MKVIIDGVEYDAAQQPFIGDLRLIKKEFGFGWGTVMARMQQLDIEVGVGALLDDDDFLDALVAWMWMIRRRAGQSDLTRAQAEAVALDQIQWVSESADERDADPTQASDQTGSDQDGANLVAVS